MNMIKQIFFLLLAFAWAAGLIAQEKAFQVGAGGSLDVNMEAGGSIEIKGSAANQVNVKWETSGRDASNIRVNAESSGTQVRITSNYVENRRQNNSGVNVWVSVPNRFNVNVRTRGGNLTIINVDGKIEGETMGGNMVFAGLKGDLRVSTKGGNISLADSDVDGKVSTMGGNIGLRNVAGNVGASTMGGNVVLDNVVQRGDRSINKMVEVSTMGGNIEVANAPRGARAETKGGNIVIKKAAEFVDVRTMGGNIAVNENSGRTSARTMGGNISAVVVPGGTDQGVDLNSMGGKIDLSLPAGYSGDFDLELAYTRRSKAYQIISDFPIRQTESPDWESGSGEARRYIRGTGTTGGGANKVKIRTVDGDIVIHKK